MYPTLIQFGPMQISSFGVALALGFIVGTFIIWRGARDRALNEEKTLDVIIVTAALSFIGARLAFVATHWFLFNEYPLRILVVWSFPGLSYVGAVVFGAVAFFWLAKRQKLKLGVLFDALGRALPAITFFIYLGIFLDGTVLGKETNWVTAMPVPTAPGLRHPVGLYGMVLSVVLLIILWILADNKWSKKNLPLGFVGWLSVFLFGFMQLLLAIFRDDLLYLSGFSIELVAGFVLLLGSLIPMFLLVDGRNYLLDFVKPIFSKIKKS